MSGCATVDKSAAQISPKMLRQCSRAVHGSRQHVSHPHSGGGGCVNPCTSSSTARRIPETKLCPSSAQASLSDAWPDEDCVAMPSVALQSSSRAAWLDCFSSSAHARLHAALGLTVLGMLGADGMAAEVYKQNGVRLWSWTHRSIRTITLQAPKIHLDTANQKPSPAYLA